MRGEADVEADAECVFTSSRSSTDGFLIGGLPTSVSYLSGSKQGKTRQAVVSHISVRGGDEMTVEQRTA